MNIAYINSYSIDTAELSEKLTKLKFSHYFSDFGFCPHIIAYFSAPEDRLEISNFNDGFFNKLRDECNIIETESIADFISELYCLNAPDDSNALF